ncbi:MAG: hypothetical protein KDK78_09635, partial [Chlamydiia bacterium]|nr:hypothetical protein [Chlamydiia bacterium]
QFLSPHYLHGASCFPRPDFINVGVYGVPKSGEDIPAMTHALELAANALGGRKMLYALNYYSEEEFWAVYDRERYDALRCAYGAESHPSLYQRTNSGSSRS